jgi:hypothetical protein
VNLTFEVGLNFSYVNIESLKKIKGKKLIWDEVILNIREIYDCLGIRIKILNEEFQEYLKNQEVFVDNQE